MRENAGDDFAALPIAGAVATVGAGRLAIVTAESFREMRLAYPSPEVGPVLELARVQPGQR